MTTYVPQLLRLVRPAWGRLLIAILVATLASGSAIALLAVSAWLIVRASSHPPVLQLMVAVVAVRFFGISRGVFRYVERLGAHEAAFEALGVVRLRLYDHLERLAPSGQLWRRGDLLTRLIGDVDSLASLITRSLVPLASTALVFAAAITTTAVILPSAGLLLLVVVAVFAVVVPALTGAGDRRDEAALVALRAERGSILTESILAAADPGLRPAAGRWLDGVAVADANEERLASRMARRAGMASAVTMVCIAGVVAGIWSLSASALAVGTIAPENAGLVTLLPLGLLELAQLVQPALAQIQSSRASAERIFDVLSAPEPVTEPDRVTALPADAIGISMSNVSVRWPDAEGPAVEGFSVDLRPGRKIALVGPSGCGKSTIVACLLGFVDANAGSFEVGGIDRRTLSGSQLRSLSAWGDQQAHLFDTTVAENVRLGDPRASDGQVRDVLRRAQLGDWIDLLPKGMGTRVGQFGSMVSGGQRQRIALARMLLADRPIMLLDEPTAGIDRPTAAALMDDIIASAEGKALLVATHDLEYLDKFDQVIDLSGQLVSNHP
ncbi:ATP-binding cassette subfamily C protein CydC [Antricoccus suffuscus]|uniref:ATP-binding cassette subfamily C protein CydC n=1 Tax=Antricoccus suffuscus TaxID=1629062 RepID=A0A2T1A0C9_9ACTN|nr:thiol reductant ABC exporter subunit CydC [Antricoccus suffuscus]PRZ42055.1 ATP-binding cassette subfamily C protein CydC [Antricoccus suffuscus]